MNSLPQWAEGYLLSGFIGMVDLSELAQADWLNVVASLHFGMPQLSLAMPGQL
jgi:NCS2 family nucleobase:cation symporter-2